MQQLAIIARIKLTRRRQNPKQNVFSMLRCALLTMPLLCVHGCGSGDNSNARADRLAMGMDNQITSKVLERGIPGEPRTLDPQLADDTYSFQVVRDLYEGLTAEDQQGRIVPGVADSWTVDATGTIYTFHLRPDARWSDGRRVLAHEFVNGLKRAVDPRTASGSATLLITVKNASGIIGSRKDVADLGVTAISESNLRIVLEHPAPFFLQVLSQPIAAPLHEVTHSSADKAKSMDSVRTFNGAYKLVDRVPGSFVELVRNPYYWNSANVLIEHVRYVIAESEATELREYVAGQLDLTWTIPMPDLNRVIEKYPEQVQMSPILGTMYLALNVTEPPLRDSLDVRQALSMALDRQLISERVMGGVTPAYSFVSQGISGYVPPTYSWAKWPREQQISYAQKLIVRAGYSEKKPLRLRLYFSSGESIQRIMLAVSSNWKQNLGVSVELEQAEFRVFLDGRKDRSRWDVARLGWYADYDDPASFLEIFARESGQDDPGYNGAQFNDLIVAARAQALPDKRVDILYKSEEALLNDYPIIPIYFYKARRLVKPYIGGAALTPLNRTYSKHLFWKPR